MGYDVAMAKQCCTHLSDTDRETLSLGLAQGQSLRTMARVLRRAPCTVSREVTATLRGADPTWPTRRGWSRPPEALPATTTAHTPGPLAVAVCPDTADSGLLA